MAWALATAGDAGGIVVAVAGVMAAAGVAGRGRAVVAADEEEGVESGSLGMAALAREGSDDVGRARSLTDDDLEELKGCVNLGLSQRFLDGHQPQPRKHEESPTVRN
jgi:hypothetical protein